MIAALEWLGRELMLNLGFGELIAKLEEYFGKTFTKIVILTVTICALLLIIGLPVTQVVYPLIIWFGALLTGSPVLDSAREGISWVVWTIWLVLTLGLIALAIRARAVMGTMEDLADKMLEASDLMHSNVNRTAKLLGVTEKRLAARKAVLDLQAMVVPAKTDAPQDDTKEPPAI